MANHVSIADSRGSIWNRWDPHIHTPGTLLNDQYGGTNPWKAFLAKVTKSQPPIRVLGITDYYSIERYEDVVRKRDAGLLPNVSLIFPNVELRFGIETSKGSWINVHLLFSPDDPNHVEEINRFLHKLEFRYPPESYCCCKADLIRLGRRHDPSVTTDGAALAVGANQFKVDFA